MGGIFLFAFTSAFNPTLLAATTVMLLLPNPRRLMLGYLAGALMTSITLGLVIIFSLHSSGTVSTTRAHAQPVGRHRTRIARATAGKRAGARPR